MECRRRTRVESAQVLNHLVMNVEYRVHCSKTHNTAGDHAYKVNSKANYLDLIALPLD